MAFEQTLDHIDDYVKQKTWYWYVPIWLVGLYVFIVLLGFSPNGPEPLIVMVPQAFDFVLHEMAHIVTAFLPSVLTAAAGSLSEILLGSVLVYSAFKTRSYFMVMTCSLWFMLACQSAGTYMADARSQKLDLVSLGGALAGETTALHDWNYVFGKLHILPLDTFIGGSVRGVGMLVGAFGLVFAAWLMYKMATATGSRDLTADESEFLRQAKTGELG